MSLVMTGLGKTDPEHSHFVPMERVMARYEKNKYCNNPALNGILASCILPGRSLKRRPDTEGVDSFTSKLKTRQ
jgi:hypothetical protein